MFIRRLGQYMGFASFMILIWDHVDTFVSEVRDVRYALKLLFTKRVG